MRGDLNEEQLKKAPPVLGMFRYEYQTPLYDIDLIVVYDSCVRCGTIYTIARDKKKRLRIAAPPPPGRRPIIGR
jgi:hypothetical protein